MEKVAIETSRKTKVYPHGPLPQFYLEKPLSEGRDLPSVTRAALQAVFAFRSPQTGVSHELRNRLWDLFQGLIVLAWAILILSLFFPGGGWSRLASILFVGIFLFAILDLPLRWEATRQAFDFLKQSRYFEIEELVHIKEILWALRLEGFAQIFKTPLGFIKKWRTKI